MKLNQNPPRPIRAPDFELLNFKLQSQPMRGDDGKKDEEGEGGRGGKRVRGGGGEEEKEEINFFS